jgi:enoyl-CoA hydratase/carnithine racemase
MSDAPASAPLLSQVEGGVALVTLNRPERLNAFNGDLGVAFDTLMVELAQDRHVRAIVLTGAGKGFCAGADAKELEKLSASGPQGLRSRPPGAAHPIYDALTQAPAELRTRFLIPAAMPQPVIAAVNGACAGVGLALACASDVRFASEEAMFAASFARRGLIAEGGLAWLLPRLVGFGAASDMLISGRKVGAEEALRIGLVGEVTAQGAVVERALAYAREIADQVSPRAAAVIKRQLRSAAEQTLRQALETGHAELRSSLASADFREGVAALRERRPPRFTGE